ncbi:MAG: phosphotransferase [Arenicella sp.]|jgi:aminoglycoside phosphotransferase (APT) family kinase protein|nr:phosphotransferase [Arenicella sp.]
MSKVDALDEERLAAYLEKHATGFTGPLIASKFPGGQSNPTFKIDAASGSYVLRRQPPEELLKSAHAVDREYRVLAALADSEVPVARVYHLCEDKEVIGSMFYLMEYVQGRVFWDPALPEVECRDERVAIYDEMNRVLAAIHNVDVEAVGLGGYGKPGNYFARQISRWSKQYRASETEHSNAMETLMAWLPENIPPEEERSYLVHGDYRLDNVMFHPTEPRIIAVLDWELSTLGSPMGDLAGQVMGWMFPNMGPVRGLGDKSREEVGIPSNEEYVASYCERTGRKNIEDWPFYLAYSIFRAGAILQGVKKRMLLGNASSADNKALEFDVQTIAQQGVELIEVNS